MKVQLAACFALLCAGPVSGTTMLFDFGNTARQAPQPPNVPTWNNVTRDTTDLFALFDADGSVVSGATLSVTDTFFDNGEPSQLGSESPSGDAAGYPVDATDDYLFGHTGPFAGGPDNQYGEVTLGGLDPNTPYNFKFFSARNGVGDNRDTQFVVTGAASSSAIASTSNNDSEVLMFPGVYPNASGEVSVGVSAGPGNDNGLRFFYINLMEINTIPEPTSAALVLLGGLGLIGRRRSTVS